MHWFMGLPVVNVMYDVPFSAWQALENQSLPYELRLIFQVWENLVERRKGFKYVDLVKVFIIEALVL